MFEKTAVLFLLLIIDAIGYGAEKSVKNDNSPCSFIENRGQFITDQGNNAEEVLFKVSQGGLDIYITSHGISYVFSKTEDEIFSDTCCPKTRSVTLHREDMCLQNAHIKKENVIAEDPVVQRFNYYLAHCPNGIIGVRGYNKITIREIYPGIDWLLLIDNNSGIKYDFIVHPGANPADIKIIYKGMEEISLDKRNKHLKLKNKFGEIEEGDLICYQGDHVISSEYLLKRGNEITINVEKYDTTHTLIIDPPLIWSTYYGGSGYDYFYSTVTDLNGNVFVTGSSSSANFPSKNPGSGAYYQPAMGGSLDDVVILKFDNSGVLLWATLYGGDGDDVGQSIAIDTLGNIYVTGQTSSNNFPLQNNSTGGYFQNSYGGGSWSKGDAFILEFGNSGIRKWGTYFGGSGNEIGNGIAVDNSANVFITGQTTSTNLPLQNPGGGAFYQNVFRGDTIYGDVFISKFNSSGTLVWGTYYGGSGGDVGHGIAIDGSGNVYVTGETQSNDFPILNPGGGGYFQASNGSNDDAFILQFTNSGVCKWATFYGGLTWEIGYAVTCDKSGNVYVTGCTFSADFPVFNPGGGAYFRSQVGMGATDAFILKFNNAGVRLWATYYGGDIYEYGYAITSDIKGNIFVAGMTTSNNLPVTTKCGPYQQNNLNSTFEAGEAFIAEFSSSGSLMWGTYFGGEYYDSGFGLTTDANGCLFLVGMANSDDFPTRNPNGGAYYQSSKGGAIPVSSFISKFCFDDQPQITATQNTTICFGNSVVISAAGAKNYIWQPIAGLSANTGATVIVSPTITTTYTVTGTGICGSSSVIVKISVSTHINTITASPDVTMVKGSSVVISAISTIAGASYSWSPSLGLNTTTGFIVTANPEETTVYYVSIPDNNGCNDVDSVKVTVLVNEVIYVPNSFTPNGDGINDFFIPQRDMNSFAGYSFIIFDRWGQKVFESNNYNQGWDGKINNTTTIAQEDVYVWEVNLNDFEHQQCRYIGRVTLLK